MSSIDLGLAMDTARAAAEAAMRASLEHFRREVVVERKPDRSPVTIADRQSEAAILQIVRAAFPDHAILAEESGAHAGNARSRWIIDPLDGTKGFSRGGLFWGPLVALEHEGEIVAGAMALPALGHVYWAARGLGCFRDGAPCRVSGIDDWSEATFAVGEPKALYAAPWQNSILQLTATANVTRCPGDLAGCAMVLDGRAEAWMEAGVQLWDLGPLPVLVEEAGGRFTDLQGNRTLANGHALASNGRVHDHVLAALRG